MPDVADGGQVKIQMTSIDTQGSNRDLICGRT